MIVQHLFKCLSWFHDFLKCVSWFHDLMKDCTYWICALIGICMDWWTFETGSSSMEEERERNLDPKPRWNPKPEQIRIIESIFNSGMVNPPSEEIQKIRMQLQEYGEVGDTNVYYWFQNRKSRNKKKQRICQGDKSSKPSSTHGKSYFDQYGPGVSIHNKNSSSFIGELSSSLLPPGASFPM